MCRHLAYLGPSVTLRSLLIDPPHSLHRQAWAPRLQRHGTVNADGFGIGWYAGADPVPARYRRGEPIWGDPSLPDIARVTSSAAVLAAVRSATPGTASGPEAAAPFGCGPWLFSHNGAAQRWRDWGEAAFASWAGPLPAGTPPGPLLSQGQPDPLPADGAPTLLSCLEALTDSALLWALTLQRLRAGLPVDAALAGTIAAVEAAGGAGRFNLLLTDGRSVAATACGDTLWYRQAPSGPGREGTASVTVASEPDDDGPGWTEVPDRHLLTATASLVRVRPLSDRFATRQDDHASPAGNDVRTEGIAIA
jgi:glutamine amidotransferase